MDFEYKAIDQQGERHIGSIEAIDKLTAQKKLLSDGLQPIECIRVFKLTNQCL